MLRTAVTKLDRHQQQTRILREEFQIKRLLFTQKGAYRHIKIVIT